jgi:chaperonin GroES
MLKPLKNRLVVELIEKDTVTAGGIILTRADANEANRGKVLAVGPEVLDITVGDVILANWNKATKTKMDGTDAYILKEEDIVLVFED